MKSTPKVFVAPYSDMACELKSKLLIEIVEHLESQERRLETMQEQITKLLDQQLDK